MRKHQRRNNYDQERAGAAAVRRFQARQPQTPVGTEQQNELLGKWAKGVHIVGDSVLTPSEYATLAQHPAINDRARANFAALAAQ